MTRIAALLCFLFSAHAWATDFYAAPGGGATATCVDPGPNVCTVARCLSVATTADRCLLASGTYPGSELGGSGYVIQTGELVDMICSGDKDTCILEPTGTNLSGIRFNSPPIGETLELTRLKINGANGTPLDQCFWYSDSTGLYTVNSTDNTCAEADVYMHRIVANEMTLNSLRDTFTTSTAVSPRSFVATIGTWAEGGVSINAANVDIDRYNDSATPIVNILATDAGETGSVVDSTFNVANDPTTLTGYIDVIRFTAIPSAVATGNTINVTGANVGSAVGPTCDASTSCRHVRAIKSYSASALDSDYPNLSDNTITLETANGVAISVGNDSSSAGDTYTEYGTASRNIITCVNTGTSTHGVGLFWSQGGRAFSNWVKGCGIGLLSKGQPTAGGTFASNILIDIAESYMYAKGSTAPKFVNNTLSVSNSQGTPVVIGIDGIINSTNVLVENNNVFSSGGQPTNLLNTASSQTLAIATSNNWYGFTSPQWTYLGTPYTSLSAWNAVGVVGTDLSVLPGFVGGLIPTTAAGFKLNSNSALIRAGVCYLSSGCAAPDYAGRRAFVPPDVGAYQRVVGDP